jgi:hypothetical protein
MTFPIVRYSIIFRPAQTADWQVLHTLTDPEEATLAFQRALGDFQARGDRGELILLNQARGHTPLLRYPLG